MKTTLATLTAGALLASSAQAASITASDPLNVAGLSAGESFQLIFVSGQKLQRDLLDGVDDGSDDSEISDWDDWVNTQADASTMTGIAGLNWTAMVSWDDQSDALAGINAKDHAVVSEATYQTDGTQIATGFADIWDGSIGSAILRNENGDAINTAGGSGSGRQVWTGSASDGTVTGTWTLGNGTDGALTGDSTLTSGGWFTGGAHLRRGPNDTRRVYALSEVINIVPEPSSLALLGLGGLMIARRRRG